MSIKTRAEPRTNKDTPRPDLVDNRGGTFDPSPNKDAHEIYTTPTTCRRDYGAREKDPWDPLMVGAAGTSSDVDAPSCGP